jgi:conjugal transfer pilin signal peptidase TrbI
VALAKPATRFGEPLALGPTGTIPRGCYFVGTPHRDSFDSRYAAIGWACRPRIIGVGEAIL